MNLMARLIDEILNENFQSVEIAVRYDRVEIVKCLEIEQSKRFVILD